MATWPGSNATAPPEDSKVKSQASVVCRSIPASRSRRLASVEASRMRRGPHGSRVLEGGVDPVLVALLDDPPLDRELRRHLAGFDRKFPRQEHDLLDRLPLG